VKLAPKEWEIVISINNTDLPVRLTEAELVGLEYVMDGIGAALVNAAIDAKHEMTRRRGKKNVSR